MLPRQRCPASPWTLVLFLFLTLSVACSDNGDSGRRDRSSEPPPERDQLLLASAKVALPPAGITQADLPDFESSDAQQFIRFCVACHDLPSPKAHSATDWPRVLRRMWLRMGMIDSSFNVPTPNASERFAILRYAEQNALKVATERLPDLPGRDLFEETCSQCHELADPYQHSSEDWVAVVRRMMGHMEDILGTTLASGDLTRISLYLSEVSKRRP